MIAAVRATEPRAPVDVFFRRSSVCRGQAASLLHFVGSSLICGNKSFMHHGQAQRREAVWGEGLFSSPWRRVWCLEGGFAFATASFFPIKAEVQNIIISNSTAPSTNDNNNTIAATFTKAFTVNEIALPNNGLGPPRGPKDSLPAIWAACKNDSTTVNDKNENNRTATSQHPTTPTTRTRAAAHHHH